jgi:hypothetical protein
MHEADYVYANALVRNTNNIPLVVTVTVLTPTTLQITQAITPPNIPPVAGNLVSIRTTTGTNRQASTVVSVTTTLPLIVTVATPIVGIVNGVAEFLFPGSAGTDQAIPFVYTEQRNTNILESAGKYEVCVEQFRFPTVLIPLMVCPIAGRTLGYVSIFTITSVGPPLVSRQTKQAVVVFPDNTDIIPVGVYYPQTLIDAVNGALLLAWTAIGSPGVAPPSLNLGVVSGLISLYAPQGIYFPDNVTAGTYYIQFSGLLYKLFNSLPAYPVNTMTPLPENTYGSKILRIENTGRNAYVAPGPLVSGGGLPAGIYWIMTQSSVSLNEWDDFFSIVILSSLPTAGELLPGVPPNEFAGPLDLPYTVDGNSNTRNTLYEWLYQPPASGGGGTTVFRNPAVFVAAGDGNAGGRRYLQLQSNQPLAQQSYFVYWQDKRYVLYPLLLAVNDYGVIKVQFRKTESADY